MSKRKAKRIAEHEHVCFPLKVKLDDGTETVARVHGDPNMSEAARKALGALVKAAYKKLRSKR